MNCERNPSLLPNSTDIYGVSDVNHSAAFLGFEPSDMEDSKFTLQKYYEKLQEKYALSWEEA